ncbi:Hypothetical predicted protein, partial [Pelobates cultripes]
AAAGSSFLTVHESVALRQPPATLSRIARTEDLLLLDGKSCGYSQNMPPL